MKIAIGSDEKTYLTDFVIEELKKRRYEIGMFGALTSGEKTSWPEVGKLVGEKVASKEYDQGILFCWTGTGVSIAANKIPGIRAALCFDAETAKGARKWNDANVLVMSLRLTSENVAREILNAWFSSEFDEGKIDRITKLREIEQKYSRS
ncbi:RpiB/LacA/LacB family sugar-phosphate isomerase [Patescibacteria group bacterium]|nr:RpiB/LacA/LacB family sugar-phosphate isomerase [Patescibacteria group bacterium]